MPRSFTGWTVPALVALALASGCGDSNEEEPPSPGAAGADLAELIEPGKLTTCTHLPYPPFQFEREGEIVGFDVALIDLVAEDLGLEQVIVDTPFETIKTGADLNAGKCDVAAAGMTITDERKQKLDFSAPYFDATQALLAKKGSGITSLDSAKDKRFGSQSATTGEDYVKSQGVDPVSFETSDAELNGLRTGQVDVTVQDLPVVAGWLKDPANADFEIVADLDTGEQYGFAVKKGRADALLQKIDEALAAARADGTYDDLYAEWIGVPPSA